MEFNLTTFILEIINFLILIWLLKYFFYAPVKQMILKRQQETDEVLNKANALNTTAKQLEMTYNNRLENWAIEREEKQNKLKVELEAIRVDKTTELTKELAKIKEKQAALAKMLYQKMLEENTKEAVALSLKFSTKLLQRFSDPGLESKILDMLLEELNSPSLDFTKILDGHEIVIETAYPINLEQKTKLEAVFNQQVFKDLKETLHYQYQENPALIAGVKISMGSVILKANIRDELRFFSEKLHG